MKIRITPIICVHVHAGGKRGFRIHGSNGWIYGIFHKTTYMTIQSRLHCHSACNRFLREHVCRLAGLVLSQWCGRTVMGWRMEFGGVPGDWWPCPFRNGSYILHKSRSISFLFINPLHCTNSQCNPSNMHGGKVMCPNGSSELCWIGGWHLHSRSTRP